MGASRGGGARENGADRNVVITEFDSLSEHGAWPRELAHARWKRGCEGKDRGGIGRQRGSVTALSIPLPLASGVQASASSMYPLVPPGQLNLSRLLNGALARSAQSNRQFRLEPLSSPWHRAPPLLPLLPLPVSASYWTLLGQRPCLAVSWVYLCSRMHESTRRTRSHTYTPLFTVALRARRKK